MHSFHFSQKYFKKELTDAFSKTEESQGQDSQHPFSLSLQTLPYGTPKQCTPTSQVISSSSKQGTPRNRSSSMHMLSPLLLGLQPNGNSIQYNPAKLNPALIPSAQGSPEKRIPSAQSTLSCRNMHMLPPLVLGLQPNGNSVQYNSAKHNPALVPSAQGSPEKRIPSAQSTPSCRNMMPHTGCFKHGTQGLLPPSWRQSHGVRHHMMISAQNGTGIFSCRPSRCTLSGTRQPFQSRATSMAQGATTLINCSKDTPDVCKLGF